MKKWLYRNRSNPHKFLEIKRYKDGHWYWRQYMQFDNGVVNPVGSKTGRFFRVSIETVKDVIMSYIWLESTDTDTNSTSKASY